MNSSLDPNKFSNPDITLDGSPRGKVQFNKLDTLWINTGTQCNLTCENCYIESSPTNDHLQYITWPEVKKFLDEIKNDSLQTKQIGFTGGEPFLNPHFIEILEKTLQEDFEVLILTNAYRVIDRYKEKLLTLKNNFPNKMTFRVSLDHHTLEVHEKERGKNTFIKTIENIKWLFSNGFQVGIAGRSLIQEDIKEATNSYIDLLGKENITINFDDPTLFTIFPEMQANKDVPEITEKCFDILSINPNHIMCSNSRMVVRKKGRNKPTVLACTLLAYQEEFEMGESLAESFKTVKLNHPFCAQFCILGGASCSAD